MSTSIHQEEIS